MLRHPWRPERDQEVPEGQLDLRKRHVALAVSEPGERVQEEERLVRGPLPPALPDGDPSDTGTYVVGSHGGSGVEQDSRALQVGPVRMKDVGVRATCPSKMQLTRPLW